MNQTASFIEKRRFIIKLGKALHKFGTPAFRLEAHLQNVAEFLEVQANFSVTPTSLTFVLWLDDDQQEYNHIARVKPGDLDLGSLARTDELVEELRTEKRTLAQALERIDEIAQKPNPYPKPVTFIAFGASSGAFAMLMHTSWHDVFLSTLLGFIVYGFVFWAEHSRRVAGMLEPLAAIVVAIITALVAQAHPEINIPLVILSGIIIFIPGLSLTLGLAELSSRDLVSGTARIMDAVMSLFKLYFGAVFGLAIVNVWYAPPQAIAAELIPNWTAWLAVGILSSSLFVIFKTRLKDAPWGVLSGFIAFSTSIWAASYLGVALGAFVGAFAVGVYSNLFARIMHAPATIVLLQGLVVLVPGSKVYIGLNTLVSGTNFLTTSDIGSQAFLIFMSLVAGLIFSNVAINPRRAL